MIGQEIKKLRKEKGLTQARLAEVSKMSASGIGRIESGERYPSPTSIELIATGLGLNPEVLKLVSLDSSNMPEHQKKSFELLKELALIQFRRI